MSLPGPRPAARVCPAAGDAGWVIWGEAPLFCAFALGRCAQRTLWDGNERLGTVARLMIEFALEHHTPHRMVVDGQEWIGPEMAAKIFLAHASEDKQQVR